jgi:hypothetical protein
MRKKIRIAEISKRASTIFAQLEAKQWRAVETELNALHDCDISKGKAWMQGYIDALHGMLRALRDRRVSLSPLNTLRYQGFFRVWYDYTKYVLDTTPKAR